MLIYYANRVIRNWMRDLINSKMSRYRTHSLLIYQLWKLLLSLEIEFQNINMTKDVEEGRGRVPHLGWVAALDVPHVGYLLLLLAPGTHVGDLRVGRHTPAHRTLGQPARRVLSYQHPTQWPECLYFCT